MVVPYKNQSKGKKEQVADMFNSISHKYDFLNHLLSGGIDIIWRKKAIKLLQNKGIKSVLDIFDIPANSSDNLHPDDPNISTEVTGLLISLYLPVFNLSAIFLAIHVEDNCFPAFVFAKVTVLSDLPVALHSTTKTLSTSPISFLFTASRSIPWLLLSFDSNI